MVVLCDDLLRLTRSYLDYAGLIQGTRPLCYGAFTISALGARLTDAASSPRWPRRDESSGNVRQRRGHDATITTDASRCQQIFGNLVANALKYTPRGGAGPDDRPARGEALAQVVVSLDSGPKFPLGIDPEGLRAVPTGSPCVLTSGSGVEGSGLGTGDLPRDGRPDVGRHRHHLGSRPGDARDRRAAEREPVGQRASALGPCDVSDTVVRCGMRPTSGWLRT